MFRRRTASLEYIFLLHGTPAGLGNLEYGIKRKRQLLLSSCSHTNVITSNPRGAESTALGSPNGYIHLQTTERRFDTNYPAHVVHPEAFHLGPQTTPRLPFLSPFSWDRFFQRCDLTQTAIFETCALNDQGGDGAQRKEWWSREGVWEGNR